MNEVEKLYSLANIKPLGNADLREMKILVDGKVFVEGKYLPNNYYNIYPPFTAKKQIFLIHLLSINRIVTIFYENQQIYISVCPNNPHDDRQICECGASWVEVLARVINSYWLLFSEEERKQIKNILE